MKNLTFAAILIKTKSVFRCFHFSDVSNKQVNFFTLNQWFDKTLFNETASQNLHFPGINFKNLKKFEEKYFEAFDTKPHEIAILAYDALGLLYYCWINNNAQFKIEQLFSKGGFKGLHGEFIIKNNISLQKLKIYKISDKKFLEVF